MSTFTVLVLIFCWGVPLWAWAALFFFLLLGCLGQHAALKRCRGFGRWLLPALLLVFWLGLEIAVPHTVNYAQLYALSALAAAMFCFLGTALGSAGWLVRGALHRRKQSAE